jgi:hypothetical protein
MRIRFDVLATDAAGEPLVPASGITWTASSEAVTGGGTGTSATFTLSAPSEAAEAVEARVGSTVCRARVTVLPAGVPPGRVRIIVTDELTGRQLPGAVVAVSDAQGNITAVSETDAQGVAWVPATKVVSLSVFHDAYGYLTLAHYDTDSGTRDVWLPLRKTPLDPHGGARGTFVNLPPSENILLGFSGMSSPDMDFAQLTRQTYGRSTPVSVNILGKPQSLNLSQGTYVSLSSTVLKSEYAAPGVAGLCDAGLAGILAPEDAIRTGTCGTRASWALAGEIPLTTVLSKDFDPKNPSWLSGLQDFNILRGFHSSVVRDVGFRLIPSHNRRDTTHYSQTNHDFQQMPLRFQFSVLVPTPPAYNKIRFNTLVGLGTADVAGRGMTVLGAGVAPIPEAPQATTPLRVHMAPTHHGLEGSPYKLFVIATSTDLENDYVADSASSTLIAPLEDLPTDFHTRRPMALPGGFLPIPDHGIFNFLPTPQEGLQGREFRFITDPGLDDATLVNVTFRRTDHRRWTVLIDPRHALTGIRLPLPPGSFHDRTRNSEDSRANVRVQAIAMRRADGSKLDLRPLVEAEEGTLARLSDFIVAFSEHSRKRPGLNWIVPPNQDEDGIIPSIDHDTVLIISITNFHVNKDPADDGRVRLSFQGGTGCSDQQLVEKVETNLAQAEAYFRIPASCRGTRVQMTATLVDSNNVPLDPPVFRPIVVNII